VYRSEENDVYLHPEHGEHLEQTDTAADQQVDGVCIVL